MVRGASGTLMDGLAVQDRTEIVPTGSAGVGARRLKVLLIAESCNPKMISVPLVGYSQAKALREVTDAHVVTHSRNAEDLGSVGWQKGVDFSTVDAEWAA